MIRLLLTSLLTGCFTLTALAAPAKMQMPPPVVQTAIVKNAEWQPQIKIIGTLASLNGVMIKPEIAGRITRLYFQSGQNITAGAPIVSLDQDILQAQLQANLANLTLRQQQFKRAQELLTLKAMSTADFETAHANLLSAQANVAQATAQLKQATMVAPFTGKLGLRLVSVGDYVNSGQPIVNLQALDPIIVNFNIPESYLGKIKKNVVIQVRSDAYPGKKFQGVIYALDNNVDLQTRTLAVRAKIANPEQQLLPGAFVTLSLPVNTAQTVTVVPQTALISTLEGLAVYKVVNQKAVKTNVVVIQRDADLAYVSKGLTAGDLIVSAGQLKIVQDNSPIMIAPPELSYDK